VADRRMLIRYGAPGGSTVSAESGYVHDAWSDGLRGAWGSQPVNESTTLTGSVVDRLIPATPAADRDAVSEPASERRLRRPRSERSRP
jgi:hypothetical protein